MDKKSFIIIISAILLITAVSYIVITKIKKTPDNTDITEWQTYQHKDWNFEIKYPKDWQVDKLGFEISNIPNDRESKDFAKKDFARVIFVRKFCQTSGPLAVGQNDVFVERLPQTEDSEAVFEKTVCSQSGIEMLLQVRSRPDNRDEYEKILNQVAGSLKFASTPTSWQTYTNERFGFQMNYPATDSRFSLVPSNDSSYDSLHLNLVLEIKTTDFYGKEEWGTTGYTISVDLTNYYSSNSEYLDKNASLGGKTTFNNIEAIRLADGKWGCPSYLFFGEDRVHDGIFKHSGIYEITDPNCISIMADDRIQQINQSFKLMYSGDTE